MSLSRLSAPGAEPFEPPGVTWSRVSPRLAPARRLVSAVTIAVPVAGTAIAGALSGASWLFGVTAALVVLALWSWWLIGRQVAAVGYAERDDDLLVRRGIMFREIVVVPYGRLQYVDVKAGPVDRLFGISQVQLHTASAGTDASIPGLAPEEAARLRDRLSARGQARLVGL